MTFNTGLKLDNETSMSKRLENPDSTVSKPKDSPSSNTNDIIQAKKKRAFQKKSTRFSNWTLPSRNTIKGVLCLIGLITYFASFVYVMVKGPYDTSTNQEPIHKNSTNQAQPEPATAHPGAITLTGEQPDTYTWSGAVEEPGIYIWSTGTRTRVIPMTATVTKTSCTACG